VTLKPIISEVMFLIPVSEVAIGLSMSCSGRPSTSLEVQLSIFISEATIAS
jgi:hypothetical protein